MITLHIPQGSIDWVVERLWRLTASQLKGNITTTGALSKSEAAMKNIDKLIAGFDVARIIGKNPEILDGMDDYQVQKWLSNYTGEKFTGNLHTRRGNDTEPDALAALADRIGESVNDVGMCIMGNAQNGVVSCSPDGLIYHGKKAVGGAEVKAPTLATYYGYIADGGLPDEYKIQVHGSMAICELDAWHFGAYFAGKPLHYVHVKRDKLTDAIAASLQEFRTLYEERFMKVTQALQKLEPQTEEVA